VKHTLESIQEKSNLVHNFKYLVVSGQTYENNKQNLLFHCKVCGNDFSQIVNNHFSGAGCIVIEAMKPETHQSLADV